MRIWCCGRYWGLRSREGEGGREGGREEDEMEKFCIMSNFITSATYKVLIG
jgi:hypothetical protein